jgi:hypothetical protein
MLFDPKWESPLSTTRILDWLGSMPAGKRYVFTHCGGHCLWDQYLRAVGLDRWEETDFDSYSRASKAFSSLHREPYRAIAADFPQTFGAALERARAALLAE